MRCLKISFDVQEDKAGTILADLAGKVTNLDFTVVEPVAFHRNKPRVLNLDLTPSRVGTTGKSSIIPKLFTKDLYGQKTVTVQQIKALLANNKMSPNSYTHAINVLKASGTIKATNDRGIYEVLK